MERRVFPVTLSDGNTYQVVGYLYYQGSLKNRPLQVLTHGITYTHKYWDIPKINGESYSYAEYMARRHYAVLALDMLGTGESSRPDGDFFDLGQSVLALKQVVDQLRAGEDGFEKIALVGHSNGALISTYVQAYFQSADAVVLTGWLATLHSLPVTPADIYPLLATPYIYLPDFMRAGLFYDAAHADPAVIAYDNASISDTMTRGQLLSLLYVMANPHLIPTQGVTGPLLVQLGDNDLVSPASFAAAEAALYPNAEVTVSTLEDMGHIFNGHDGREQGWAEIDAWLRTALR